MHNGSNDVFLQPLVPFEDLDDTILIFRGQNPPKNPFGGINMPFRANTQNIKTATLSKLLHRFQPNFAQR